MIIESAQLLCTAVRLTLDPEQTRQAEFDAQGLYKATHKNHPCAVWTRKNSGNFYWVMQLGKQLCAEYTYRYGKVHKTESVINRMAMYHNQMPPGLLRSFIFCGPEEIQERFAALSNHSQIVNAYRTYYYEHKRDICKWTRREQPEWF